jgi:hypothetical protein
MEERENDKERKSEEGIENVREKKEEREGKREKGIEEGIEKGRERKG